MIAWLLSEFGGWLAGAGAVIVALVTAWWRGRRSGQSAAKTQATRAALEAERKREEIEDDIQQDPDLAARARRSGLVRPER